MNVCLFRRLILKFIVPLILNKNTFILYIVKSQISIFNISICVYSFKVVTFGYALNELLKVIHFSMLVGIDVEKPTL